MLATPLRRAALGAGALLAAVAACGGERPELRDEPQPTTTEESTTTTAPDAPEAEVAQAKQKAIDVYADEDARRPDRQVVAGVDTSVDTIPVVFLVKEREEDADRLEVHLPARPNGTTGWVDAADVTVTAVDYKIEVGLAAHRLRVLKDDEVVLDEPAGIGPDRPDPGGVYYLRELLELPDPDGEHGRYAYGLPGFANILQSINEGDGVVGIHGTDEPDEVGTDTSSGSIGLVEATIARMVEEIGLPLGTPVDVKA